MALPSSAIFKMMYLYFFPNLRSWNAVKHSSDTGTPDDWIGVNILFFLLQAAYHFLIRLDCIRQEAGALI